MCERPDKVVVTPDGTTAVTISHFDDKVSIIDVATNAVRASVQVPSHARDVAITPDGTKAVVVDEGVTVIDLQTASVEKKFHMWDQPSGVGITPDGALALISSERGGELTPINLPRGRKHKSFFVKFGRTDVTVTPDGKKAILQSHNGMGGVTVVDLTTSGPTPHFVDLPRNLEEDFNFDSVAVTPDSSTALICIHSKDLL